MENCKLDALAEKVIAGAFLELEASGRHVHLTRAQAHTLFGHELTPQRPLSQPGQFLAKERLTVVGPKGALHNVAVLGPEREEAQVEISLTDGKALGITPPVRLSGNGRGSPGAALEVPAGRVELAQGVIAAQRHIHLTPEAGLRLGVSDREVVALRTYTERPVVFQDVVVRIHRDFAPRVHLDYDEANACGFRPGDLGRIVK